MTKCSLNSDLINSSNSRKNKENLNKDMWINANLDLNAGLNIQGLRRQISSCHLLKKATDVGCVNLQTSGGFLERDTTEVVSRDRESNPPTQSSD